MSARRLLAVGVTLVASAVLVVVGLYGYAASLPTDHVVTRAAVVEAEPEAVWALIAEPEAGLRWRTGLEAVERLPPVDGRMRWREVGAQDLVLERVEQDPPRRLVTRTVDAPDLEGRWTWELAEADGGTRVTITEEGRAHSPIFRLLLAHVFDPAATVEGVLDALSAHHGHALELVPPG